MWLHKRLFDQGGQTNPEFAFQGTVNWMRALAILCTESNFSHDELKAFYARVQRRHANEASDNLAFEHLIMSMHNVSALNSMGNLINPYLIIRSAIVAWYYAIYYSSKAMIAATSGADPQT
jgi:hypothetical protein